MRSKQWRKEEEWVARRFDWVWLSTDVQVAALIAGYSNASWATKLLGRYDIPSGVAHIRGILLPWARIPLVFKAEGQLTISDSGLAFSARRRLMFGWRQLDLQSDLSFECAKSDLVSVEPADFSSPVTR